MTDVLPKPRPKRLSKSRFCYGLQCEKQLWWRVHEPDAPELAPAPGLQAIFDRGSRVGELARERFPGGVLIDGDDLSFGERLRRTRDAIAAGAPAIFEAAFAADGVYAAVDALERRQDGWVLAEVKSTLDVKPAHIPDVAIQLHVLRTAGLDVRRAELMHLNRACTFPDLSNLFIRDDVTAPADALLPAIPGQVRRFQEMLAGPLPVVEVGPQCGDPYECPFLARCWPQLPPHHVSTIYRVGSRAGELAAEGVAFIHDLPEDVVFSDVAARQVRSVRLGELVVETRLANALAAIEAPVAFLDFETINPAVSAWNGCHPYGIVPVQMSCHVLDAAGRLEHHEHLADGPGDPRPAIAEAVIAACQGARTVLAYNASFERRCLEHLASFVPAHATALQDVAQRLTDLLPIVRDHVYHPAFGGSFGLKGVVSALLPDLGYADLDIAEGGTASSVLEGLLLGDGEVAPDLRARLRTQLLEYCKRDTLVMVRLLAWLRERAVSVPLP
jgi:hypothetical protein